MQCGMAANPSQISLPERPEIVRAQRINRTSSKEHFHPFTPTDEEVSRLSDPSPLIFPNTFGGRFSIVIAGSANTRPSRLLLSASPNNDKHLPRPGFK